MSKGHVFLAQQSSTDYILQAYALALSIKQHNKQFNQTCLITNDPVPTEFRHVFDKIVSIPWNDSAENSQWKIENRWKIIHATPFKENIVYDTDMLLLSSNDHWWKYLSKRDVCLTSTVYTYRGEVITNDYYRKVFTDNSLPNVYMGVHYFKKTRPAYEFYKWLQVITENYQSFYDRFTPKSKQKFCSMDINAALAVNFMDMQSQFVSTIPLPSFVHMKPAVQGWHQSYPNKWQDVIMSSYDDNLFVGNYIQTGVFHYTEDDFLTLDLINSMKESFNG